MSALGQKQTLVAKSHVRFTPDSGHVRATRDVRYVPIADMRCSYSITSSARVSSAGGTVRPSALAVLRLITNSNFVGCITGK